jgi:2-polyprenyl-3-methyl-5-hydroxy-6-metoxy-1,4-benzoquinol methylase
MHLAEQRRILDRLPLDAWEVLTDCIMQTAIGNRYDEKVEVLGDQLWVDWGARNLQLLEWLEQERLRLNVRSPSVLDVGCWQGKLVAELCQRRFFASGTDLAGMEGSVANHVLLSCPEHRPFYQGFTRGWGHEVLGKMEPGSVDIVVCAETLEHVPSAVLPETCQALLRVAQRSVFVEVPGWDDGSALHLRIFTMEELGKLFLHDGWRMIVLQEPGGGCYTTVKMVR